MTDDIISRKAASEAMRCLQTYKLCEGDDMLLVDVADVLTELMMLPSAHPEIVRCKDCIYFHENVFGDEIGLGKPYDNLIVGHNGCGRLAPKGDMIYVSQDGFCFLAEKKWED